MERKPNKRNSLKLIKRTDMRKNYIYTIFAAIVTLLCSCDGMDAPYADFIKDGPIVYIGKADSLKAFSGKERVKLAWQMRNDPRGVKAKIFWRDRTESEEITLDRSKKEFEYIINDLDESTYVFEVVIYDKYGNSSLAAEVTAEVYGEVYESYLYPRSCYKYSGKLVYIDKTLNKWVVTLNAIRDNTMINTEVVYVDKNGNEQTVSWSEKSQKSLVLEDYVEGNMVKYRSCFSPQENAIDDFWTDYTYFVKPAEN